MHSLHGGYFSAMRIQRYYNQSEKLMGSLPLTRSTATPRPFPRIYGSTPPGALIASEGSCDAKKYQ
jgi:hypothetical protein